MFLVAELGAKELAVQAGDVSQADLLGALGSTSAGVRTVAKAKLIHLSHHRFSACLSLNLALREQSELANLGSHEEHSRAVLASSSTSTATDAAGSIHRLVSSRLGDRDSISVGHTAGINRDEASGSHDLVVSLAVNHQILDNRECMAAPWLNGDGVTIVELTHVELAGGDGAVWSVRMTVDVHRAHTADTLAAVVIEGVRVFVLTDELLVEDIHHLQERCTLEDVFEFVGLEETFSFRSGLTPNANFNVNVAVHVW